MSPFMGLRLLLGLGVCAARSAAYRALFEAFRSAFVNFRPVSGQWVGVYVCCDMGKEILMNQQRRRFEAKLVDLNTLVKFLES